MEIFFLKMYTIFSCVSHIFIVKLLKLLKIRKFTLASFKINLRGISTIWKVPGMTIASNIEGLVTFVNNRFNYNNIEF